MTISAATRTAAPVRPRASLLAGVGPVALALGLLVPLGGCASGSPAHRPATSHESPPSASELQRAASSAANGGNVNVRLVDGVAYVTGRVDSALEESAIRRALLRIDGVSDVRTALQRDM